ncbi:MAG TPA: hypothetical protein PLU37_02240 [Chitinophagaceae bacterium]|nr:hypothetical protein [Chitinophagaceae bacterium]
MMVGMSSAIKDPKAIKATRGLKAYLVSKVIKVCLEIRAIKDPLALKVCKDLKEPRVIKVIRA